MHLTLYHNSSERKVIGKSLSNLGVTTGIIKGDASIMAPTFILEYDPVSPPYYLTDVNYLYWRQAQRFYFVDDIQVLTGKRVLLICSVDVLQTYRTAIKQQVAIIDKQESRNETNLYISDGSFVSTEQTFNEIKNFQTGFNETGEFILINAGA